MIAATLAPSGEIEVGEATQPDPGPGEVLIRVRAAGITTTELSWSPTTQTKTGAPRLRAIPGHEFSGVIEAAGEGVGSDQIGREVYGMNDWYVGGALAEYCVAPWTAIASKPSRLSHEEAASVPIGALTAWQGLFEHAKLEGGERVLVHGGSGGVGLFAVQLARQHDAHVISTASASNVAFVSELGAETVIDYRSTPFEKLVRDMDVIFDTVGGETLERSWATLRPGGRMVTIASPPDGATDRHKKAFFIVEPSRHQLEQVAALLDAGKLRAAVDSVVPLKQSPQVYAAKFPRQGRGKIVVAVST